MKKYFSIFILIGLSISVSAQIPGYQGKRFMLGYNASSFVFIDGFRNFPEALRLSYKTEISANYTVSRKASLGMSYYYGRQKYAFDDYRDYSTGNYYQTAKEFVPVNLHIIEFHIQLYDKNFVAPAGIYYQLGFGIVKYNLANPEAGLEMKNSSVPLILEAPKDMLTGTKVSLTIGKTNPINHYLYINTAFGLNYFTGGDLANYITVQGNGATYIRDSLRENMFRHNCAEIKIGLGWIAF